MHHHFYISEPRKCHCQVECDLIEASSRSVDLFRSQIYIYAIRCSIKACFNMVQKLEQGSIVFIDVPTQLPDLSPSKGTLLPLLYPLRRYIGTLCGATPTLLLTLLTVYLTSLLCSSGLVIPR